MSEPRKNHLSIDGGQVKEDDHVASYKPIPESDTVPEFRTSKSSLAKSREKVSSDGAEEKLLSKEDEAKITTRVDMADAKYVVGDHRNGDAKIELDANKRQFTGLTKEELMKYADDPFWVRLRWFMFILFWALWLCMLAGAIAIIWQAPRCPPPPPRKWFEKGPLVDMSASNLNQVEASLPLLQTSKVAGIFAYTCKDTYEVLDDPSCLDQFKEFVAKAKNYGVKVIVDLTANFVSKTHKWFELSENRSSVYNDYFVWRPIKEYDSAANSTSPNTPKEPNNWVSTLNEPAWSLSEKRNEFYLHRFGSDQPDLNMSNPDVVKQFDAVIKKWMEAGADGIRLHHARLLLVDPALPDESIRDQGGIAMGADHTQYAFWKHQYSADQPGLEGLLAHWAHLVDNAAPAPGLGETVFTLAEGTRIPKLSFTSLRPPSLAPLPVVNATEVSNYLEKRITTWPAVQLTSGDGAADSELASFAMLLPAAPVLDLQQLEYDNTSSTDERLAHLVSIREDASIEHGYYHISDVATESGNPADKLLACARWKKGHTGYVAVYNPRSAELRANLTALQQLPDELAVHHASADVKAFTNYTINYAVKSDDVLVPGKSTVILSYVPKKAVEK